MNAMKTNTPVQQATGVQIANKYQPLGSVSRVTQPTEQLAFSLLQ